MAVGAGNIIKNMSGLDEQVRVEGDSIVINLKFEYSIPISECAAHQQVTEQLVQLCGKTWISPEILKKFILVACKENNLDLNL